MYKYNKRVPNRFYSTLKMMRATQLTILVLVLFFNVLVEAKRFECSQERSCGCGHSNVEINARIIGGEEAVPFSWSMVVSLRYDFLDNGNQQMHVCGGTILTDSYILTAASCLDGVANHANPKNVTIAAGMHRRSQPHQVVREIDRIIAHSEWLSSSSLFAYDIALLHLSEPLDFQTDPFISRTCLPSQLDTSEELLAHPPANTSLFVVGWGRKIFHGDNSDHLHQLAVSSIDTAHPKCDTIIFNPDRQFCTGLELVSTGKTLRMADRRECSHSIRVL